MRYFKFKVCFRDEDDISKSEVKTYIITGSMLDLNDAWAEVLQMACTECKKHNQFVSSIYYSLF